jgi:putative acetyltransferase
MRRMADLDIRPLEPNDARAAFEIVAHPEVARALGGTPLDSPHAYEQRFRASFGPGGVERLGAFEGGRLAGLVEIARGARARIACSAQLALAVHPTFSRRGVGGALLDAALDAADRWMHLVRLEVEAIAEDGHVHRLFTRRGFVAEVHRRAALLTGGALADTVTFGRIRPGFTQAEGVLRPMPAPPPRRAPPASILVRPTSLDDAASIARFSQDPTILFASSQTPMMGTDHWRTRIEAMAAAGWFAVAVVDGEVIAAGGLHPFDSPRRRHSISLGLSVTAAYQGMGIGDRLMRVLLDQAVTWLGMERVELMVLVDNERAIRLYEKLGFEREGVVRYDIWRDGGYADSLVMAKLHPRRQ